MGYLYAATTVVWGGTLVYILMLLKRQAFIRQELNRVLETLTEENLLESNKSKI